MSSRATLAKSLMPLGHMKLLKPSAPPETSSSSRVWLAAFSGTKPAQKPTFVHAFTWYIQEGQGLRSEPSTLVMLASCTPPS
jgi:hypothetical protein